MASQDYGRTSVDDSNEERPLLGQDGEDVAHPAPFYQRVLTPLKHPESLRPLEKVLLLLSLVLLLLFAVFVGLYAGAKSRLGHMRPPPGSEPSGPGGELPCTTAHCVLTAGEILHSIDPSVDPCDDFYTFSTGTWLEEHPIPGDAGLFGMAQFISANNARSIRRLLENQDDTPSHAAKSDPITKIDERNLAKLRNFYDSCMDRNAQDKAGASPVLDIVDELSQRLRGASDDVQATTFLEHFTSFYSEEPLEHGLYLAGEPVPPNQPPARAPKHHSPTEPATPLPPTGGRQKGLTQALAWAHTRGFPVLFEWYTDGEPKVDPNMGTAYLAPSGLGFPSKAYYTDEDELAFYLDVVTESLMLLDEAERKHSKGLVRKGASKAAIKKLAKLVVDFETALAEITPNGEDLEDPLATYNPTKLAALSYSFTSVDWSGYMASLAIRAPESVIVQSPRYVKSLDSLISRTKTEVLVGYFAWSALRVTGLQLGPSVPLRQPIDRLDKRSKGVEPDAKEDRSGFCLTSLNEHLGFLAGRFFVREAFSPKAKETAETIIADIIAAFKERLPELAWLDPKTRRKAEVKASAVNIKVGYPESSPNTTDAAAMERYYADLDVVEGDFFGNIVRSWSRASKTGWRNVGRKLDRGRWDMFPAEVNAYYNPGGNEIVFPAGILQPQYFSEFWPSYLQYGAFGSVAGHELSHAFDPSGRLFDEKGRLHDWWTNDTATAFNKRRDCLVDQYANYTIPNGKGGEEHLRSRFTIGEDVADAGGLAQSYRAWRDHLANGGDKLESNGLLPGVPYTREQMFFMAYAIGWARNIRTAEAIRRLRTDEHSPTKYRVIGALSNSVQFAEAFGCKAGRDRMARSDEERCEIW